MQTSLERIAIKARRNKRHRFQNLFMLINEDFLLDCWKELNKKAAPGIDGINYHEYQENLDGNVRKLVGRLKRKSYRAKLVRRKYIPKGNGKTRPLGIPATEDKLLQYSVMRILQAIYEEDFLDCSFGYRPNRCAKDAIKEVRKTLQNDWCNYVVEADIKGFFDNIDHDWLIKMLEQRINDKSTIWLIKKWLKAGVLETDGKICHPVTGSPQGGIISPILANIYMHYVLNMWFDRVVKRYCKGKAYLCVYADDFICIFRSKENAEKFYRVLSKRFGKFKLELASEKTNIIEFKRGKKTKFDFLGFEFRIANKMNRKIQIRTSRKKFHNSIRNMKEWCRKNRSKRLVDFFKILNAKLRGYYNYYGLRENSKSLWSFFYRAIGFLYKWLNRRSQRRSYKWKGLNELLRKYKIEKPRIVE
jgi:group II intron reverse transcriptase/maturase